MAKFIANISLTTLAALNTLGNYWYTFGLWPKSWFYFFLFFGTGMTLMILQFIVNKSDD